MLGFRFGNRQGCLLFELLLNIVVKLSHGQYVKEVKDTQAGEENIKSSLIENDVILNPVEIDY